MSKEEGEEVFSGPESVLVRQTVAGIIPYDATDKEIEDYKIYMRDQSQSRLQNANPKTFLMWRYDNEPFVHHKTKEEALKEGTKFDAGKIRFTLLEPTFVWGTAQVLEYGAVKYSVNNWRKGMNFSRPYNAILRHLHAWFVQREEYDPEAPSLHHLDEAACELMFLRGYAANLEKYRQFDDRKSVFQESEEKEEK